jgi:hypothetical protein
MTGIKVAMLTPSSKACIPSLVVEQAQMLMSGFPVAFACELYQEVPL